MSHAAKSYDTHEDDAKIVIRKYKDLVQRDYIMLRTKDGMEPCKITVLNKSDNPKYVHIARRYMKPINLKAVGIFNGEEVKDYGYDTYNVDVPIIKEDIYELIKISQSGDYLILKSFHGAIKYLDMPKGKLGTDMRADYDDKKKLRIFIGRFGKREVIMSYDTEPYVPPSSEIIHVANIEDTHDDEAQIIVMKCEDASGYGGIEFIMLRTFLSSGMEPVKINRETVIPINLNSRPGVCFSAVGIFSGGEVKYKGYDTDNIDVPIIEIDFYDLISISEVENMIKLSLSVPGGGIKDLEISSYLFNSKLCSGMRTEYDDRDKYAIKKVLSICVGRFDKKETVISYEVKDKN